MDMEINIVSIDLDAVDVNWLLNQEASSHEGLTDCMCQR